MRVLVPSGCLKECVKHSAYVGVNLRVERVPWGTLEHAIKSSLWLVAWAAVSLFASQGSPPVRCADVWSKKGKTFKMIFNTIKLSQLVGSLLRQIFGTEPK